MNKEELLQHDEKFRYQLLDRMRTDCDYYLGFGNGNVKCLWAQDEKEQIEYMEALYDSFDADKKPEWLTLRDIEEYGERIQFVMELRLCESEIEKLIEVYGDRTVYELDSLYDRFGVDVVNKARDNLRGKVTGL